MSDRIEITVLEDGQIKIKTEGISQTNHCSADELLGMIEKLAGGKRSREKLKKGHQHIVEGSKVYHRH